MTENGFTARDNGVFEVSGQVTFQSVPRFLAHTDKWLQGGAGKVTIDMRGVTLADSAGLALMIEWLQLARSAKRDIVFTNMPDQMRDLIRVNGLTQIFGIKNGQD
ncbi:MAG: STAS domain-containing protein [Gammaproteobacteria bacterium]|nr:STAS domain-containing protein [Gammaproteobacteria bacterium]